MGTLAIIVIIQRVFKGFMATVAVLAGLVIGTGVAFFLGDATLRQRVDLAVVRGDHPVLLRHPEVLGGGDHLDDRGHVDHRGGDHR